MHVVGIARPLCLTAHGEGAADGDQSICQRLKLTKMAHSGSGRYALVADPIELKRLLAYLIEFGAWGPRLSLKLLLMSANDRLRRMPSRVRRTISTWEMGAFQISIVGGCRLMLRPMWSTA